MLRFFQRSNSTRLNSNWLSLKEHPSTERQGTTGALERILHQRSPLSPLSSAAHSRRRGASKAPPRTQWIEASLESNALSCERSEKQQKFSLNEPLQLWGACALPTMGEPRFNLEACATNWESACSILQDTGPPPFLGKRWFKENSIPRFERV